MIHILIAGSGALGSAIAQHIAKENVRLFLLDDDTVEEKNIQASVFTSKHVGMKKAEAVAEIARGRGAEVIPLVMTLEGRTLLETMRDDIDLVVDCFDNAEARTMTTKLPIPTLHVGMGTDGNGIAFWDEVYTPPKVESKRGENPVCTGDLGKTLSRRTSLRAAEIIEEWMNTDKRINDIIAENG